MATVIHEQDEDCTVVDGECVICLVSHGEPCPACGRCGFHRIGCVALAEEIARDTEISKRRQAENAATPPKFDRNEYLRDQHRDADFSGEDA